MLAKPIIKRDYQTNYGYCQCELNGLLLRPTLKLVFAKDVK